MSQPNPGDEKLAALLSAGAIIAGFLWYWGVQIQDVLELLELAYG